MAVSKLIYDIPNVICCKILRGHDYPIESVLIRDNYIISASRSGKINIWDLTTGKILRSLNGHSDFVNSLDSYGGKLVSGGNDKILRVWDIKTGECLMKLEGHSKPILSVCITEDLIASGSDDHTIRIWDGKSGDLIRVLKGHARSVSGVRIIDDTLYSSSWDHGVRIWDLECGDCLGEREEHFDAINTIDVSEEYIATGDQTGYINIWDIKTLELLHTLKHHKLAIMHLKIDGNYIYTTSKDKTICITDLSTGICVKKLEGHSDATVGIDKQNNFIVSCSADKTIRIWDDFSLHSKFNFKAHQGLVLGAKAYDKTLVTTGNDNLLKIWDIKSGSLIKKVELENEGWNWGLAFKKNQILVSSDEGNYRLYDLESGKIIQTLKGHKGKTYRTMIRDNRAITSGGDNTARVWDLESGKCLHILKGHTYPVYSSVITEDGKFITGSSDGTIRVWNNEGIQLRVIDFHNDEIFHLEVQGEYVVSASGDGICGVFNFNTGDLVAKFDDHTDQVWTVFIHKNLVFSGSKDKTIKIWDLDTQLCINTLEGHKDGVKDLTLDGNYLISGSYDSQVRIWDISKHLDLKLEISEKISSDFDTLAAQIQMGRTYELIHENLGDPEVIGLLYGMKSSSESSQDTNLILNFKDRIGTWDNLGRIAYAPWLSEIAIGIQNGTIPLKEDESVETILQKYISGFRDNGDLYWMGLLRRYGNKLETLFPKKWTFRLDFSGQGPNPLEGYEWQRLGPKINKVNLKDREETALVFRLTLENINEWILPLVKAFEIQIKDDRGDVNYVNFSNFLPDEQGNWYTTAMFKIDAGYKMEPNAMLYFSDINVIYENLLAPSFQGTNILKQISIIRRENEDLRQKLESIEQQMLLLSEKIISTEVGKVLPEQKQKIKKAVLPGYKLENLYSYGKSKKIFQRIEKQYQEPVIGVINVEIGEKFNKFLEHIQPKFILFTSATSITTALLAILLYIQGFTSIDLLGNFIDLGGGNIIPLTEIILYILVYGILIIILVVSIIMWSRYQSRRRKQRRRL
jgi:WD40 repeat protein